MRAARRPARLCAALWRDERGSITIELAVITAVWLLGFLALVVFAGRVAQAEGDVRSAAHEGARAATLEGTPGSAEATARATVAANLDRSGVACANGMAISVETTGLAPGSYVTVAVSCNASFADVAGLRVPGSRTFSASATEIVDVYRSATP